MNPFSSYPLFAWQPHLRKVFWECLLWSLVLGLLANWSIPLQPVPITLQTAGVIYSGLALGPRKGFYVNILLLVEGSFGLPFFANGNAGVGYLLGPSGGYLLAFPLLAYLSGWARGNYLATWLSLGILIGAQGVLYLLGAWRLSHFVGWESAWLMGIWPFVPTDALKLLMAWAFYQARPRPQP